MTGLAVGAFVVLTILVAVGVLRWPPAFPTTLPRLPPKPRRQPTCRPYPGKRVVLVTVNEHYLDFFENWQWHAKPFWDLQRTQLVVSAESTTVAPMLHNLSHRSLLPFDVVFDENWTWSRNGRVEFKAPVWAGVVTHRARQIASLVADGCDVLYADVDGVWRKPVFPILDNTSAPLLVTSDDDKGCRPPFNLANMCTCFLYFRPTPGNVKLLAEWAARSQNKVQNQVDFGALLNRTKPPLAVLPFEQFPPGSCMETHNESAVVAHANYLVGLEAKRAFLRRWDLWRAGQ